MREEFNMKIDDVRNSHTDTVQTHTYTDEGEAMGHSTGDGAQYRAARTNQKRGIWEPKAAYRRWTEDHLSSNNSKQVWQGVQQITNYKSSNLSALRWTHHHTHLSAAPTHSRCRSVRCKLKAMNPRKAAGPMAQLNGCRTTAQTSWPGLYLNLKPVSVLPPGGVFQKLKHFVQLLDIHEMMRCSIQIILSHKMKRERGNVKHRNHQRLCSRDGTFTIHFQWDTLCCWKSSEKSTPAQILIVAVAANHVSRWLDTSTNTMNYSTTHNGSCYVNNVGFPLDLVWLPWIVLHFKI